jgi:hypothetical protein
MSLGELIPGNLSVYYRLEDENDSSGNGVNLTNTGVTFTTGRYSNCADFGSSGTTNGLMTTTNPCLTTTPDELFVGCRVRFNTTANTSRNHFIWFFNTVDNATTGRYFACYYTITGGVATFNILRWIGSTIVVSVSNSVTTNDWYFIWIIYSKSRDNLGISFQTNDILKSGISTNTTTGQSINLGVSTNKFGIGNNYNRTLQGYIDVDEFIISESLYSELFYVRSRSKYWTQSRGFLV